MKFFRKQTKEANTSVSSHNKRKLGLFGKTKKGSSRASSPQEQKQGKGHRQPDRQESSDSVDSTTVSPQVSSTVGAIEITSTPKRESNTRTFLAKDAVEDVGSEAQEAEHNTTSATVESSLLDISLQQEQDYDDEQQEPILTNLSICQSGTEDEDDDDNEVGIEVILPGSAGSNSAGSSKAAGGDHQEDIIHIETSASSSSSSPPPPTRTTLPQNCSEEHRVHTQSQEEEKKDDFSRSAPIVPNDNSAFHPHKLQEALNQLSQNLFPKPNNTNKKTGEEDAIITDSNHHHQCSLLQQNSRQPTIGGESMEEIAGAFMQALTCTGKDAQNCATLPGNIGGIVAMPATACQPIVNQRASSKYSKAGKKHPSEYFNAQFATKFLHGMLNVGYTLVYHMAAEDDEDWTGRTVTMSFLPGICTTQRLSSPSIQWRTMGGGKGQDVEQGSIGLLDIDAITVSNIHDELGPASDNTALGEGGNSKGGWLGAEQYEDELECFFTITRKDGEVYLFEALSSEESHRIVSGIKNMAYWMSSKVIAGDSKAVSDYFDNSQEPSETHLGKDEAIMRISHALMNDEL